MGPRGEVTVRYVAFIHRDDDTGFGISFPDFPGCVAVGGTVDDAIRHGCEALAFHAEGLREDGAQTPPPRSFGEIEADSTLADWRRGADIAFLPLIPNANAARRVDISIDRGRLDAIDHEAGKRRVTRSAFFAGAAPRELETT